MDHNCFDDFTRSLDATASRRGFARALAGGGFGALVGALGLTLWHGAEPPQLVAAKNCKKIKAKKKRKKCQQKARQTNPGVSPPPPPPPPAPVPVLTYQCPGPAESSLGIGPAGTARIAQTLTASQSGSLQQIQFEAVKADTSTGDYVVELLAVGTDGKPTNTVLATATIPNGSVPDGDTPLTATFSSGSSLTAGTEYAAAASRPGGNQLQFTTRVDDDCAGTAFAQNPSGSGAFNALGGGATDFIISVSVVG